MNHPAAPNGDAHGEWDVPADQALPRLVDRYGGRLYGLARHVCGDPTDAQDLVQEVFLTAWRRWEGFERRSDPVSWLFTIATRACARMHRKKSGEPSHVASLDDGGGAMEAPDLGIPDAIDDLLRVELRDAVAHAVAQLPDEFRMPLVLKDIAELSLEQVGRVLEIKPQTVKTRVHRARMRVRAVLDAALPRAATPPPSYPPQVCFDLLNAKNDAIDRGIPMPGIDEIICERCQVIFKQLDLGLDVCRSIVPDSMPEDLRASCENPGNLDLES